MVTHFRIIRCSWSIKWCQAICDAYEKMNENTNERASYL